MDWLAEAELDQLIAGCGLRTSVFLQLLKETGMRAGEAIRLKWMDIDFLTRTVRVTPEKGSEPRLLKLSMMFIEMFTRLQNGTRSDKVFCKNLYVKQIQSS